MCCSLLQRLRCHRAERLAAAGLMRGRFLVGGAMCCSLLQRLRCHRAERLAAAGFSRATPILHSG